MADRPSFRERIKAHTQNAWAQAAREAAASFAADIGRRPIVVPETCKLAMPEFIPAVDPRYFYPDHLAELFDVFEAIERAARGEGPPVKAIVCVPPQHGKSTAVHTWLARFIGRFPHLENAYCSYGATFAETQSRKIRNYAERAGIELSEDSSSKAEWLTPHGGGLRAVGIGGGLTGNPITGVGVIDDPVKDRVQAESVGERNKQWEWKSDVFDTRLAENASEIVVMTRWHVDDMVGRLKKQHAGSKILRVIELKAISTNPDGSERALAPKLKSLDFLREKRRKSTVYSWEGMFQQNPLTRGGAVFGDLDSACLVSPAEVPRHGRTVIGVDLAYTARTSADYTVALVLREANGARWVVEVLRFQKDATDGVDELQAISARYPNAPMLWHGSTTEVGGAKMIAKLGLRRLRAELAQGDKFVRAQEAAGAWKAGDIRVPVGLPWTQDFLDEVQTFTGVGDTNDDQVDALSSAWTALGTFVKVQPEAGEALGFAPLGPSDMGNMSGW